MCAVVGIENSRHVVGRLDPAGVVSNDTSTPIGIRRITFISQGNLLRLVAQSRKPEAVVFERHVLAELNPEGVRAMDTLQALERLDDDEKAIVINDTPGGLQEQLIISEPGLYELVLTSRKPEAQATRTKYRPYL